MKARLSTSLAILIASVAVGVDGAPHTAVIPPLGGTMAPGPVGGQMFPGAIGGMISPPAFPGPLMPIGSALTNGLPGGIYSYKSGGTLSNGGVGGMIVAGGANSLPGGILGNGGVGGSRSSVIVAGGSANSLPGGTVTPGTGGTITPGTGGKLAPGTGGESANFVIIAGGSAN
jgi:hypothetical protein